MISAKTLNLKSAIRTPVVTARHDSDRIYLRRAGAIAAVLCCILALSFADRGSSLTMTNLLTGVESILRVMQGWRFSLSERRRKSTTRRGCGPSLGLAG